VVCLIEEDDFTVLSTSVEGIYDSRSVINRGIAAWLDSASCDLRAGYRQQYREKVEELHGRLKLKRRADHSQLRDPWFIEV
jgi:hypothetical protein